MSSRPTDRLTPAQWFTLRSLLRAHDALGPDHRCDECDRARGELIARDVEPVEQPEPPRP